MNAVLNILFVVLLACVGVMLFCLLSLSHPTWGMLALTIGALAGVVFEEIARPRGTP
ncbi:MAG TPA: hypothetical protein VME63_02345 [Dyella sp.]|uniref:hypothetical protein n=1 Tax=Dyella sp. TaxID=1869338 RepID=UPI002C3D951B|nr:hypothetical protein [Dyella sp.]HTV84214.1 hypothetical protein [Dyella sp.]